MQQGAGLDRCREVRFEHADEVGQRVTGIDDVFDNQHVTSLDIAADIHDESYCAALASGTVTRDGNELDSARNGHVARQVGKKYEGAFEDANQHDFAGICIVSRNLCREFAYAFSNIGFRD